MQDLSVKPKGRYKFCKYCLFKIPIIYVKFHSIVFETLKDITGLVSPQHPVVLYWMYCWYFFMLLMKVAKILTNSCRFYLGLRVEAKPVDDLQFSLSLLFIVQPLVPLIYSFPLLNYSHQQLYPSSSVFEPHYLWRDLPKTFATFI